jgi:hypothetical protein
MPVHLYCSTLYNYTTYASVPTVWTTSNLTDVMPFRLQTPIKSDPEFCPVFGLRGCLPGRWDRRTVRVTHDTAVFLDPLSFSFCAFSNPLPPIVVQCTGSFVHSVVRVVVWVFHHVSTSFSVSSLYSPLACLTHTHTHTSPLSCPAKLPRSSAEILYFREFSTNPDCFVHRSITFSITTTTSTS